jgi:hypothetical protein
LLPETKRSDGSALNTASGWMLMAEHRRPRRQRMGSGKS